ncbi:hypothetical protein [Sandaracinus amylolyticus]|uniref:Uncharacterized protein n=1 Tax=Sandaracinus amylolyticus TaxID=927083 RepID=A0A0F6WAM5_9BACT|nr:hypothetical protein [Sandaracinus amylolyticus]AKF11675.1 hypothetical protein DB32_008824 [Sandaracinus amylolyticus]
MATKKKSPIKKSPTKKAAPSAAIAIEVSLAASYPTLGEAQQRAFLGQVSIAKCAELGARTKAEGVYRDAQKWAPIIHTALQQHPVALRRYGRARFAWFLLCLRELGERVATQKGKRSKATSARTALERAIDEAKAVRALIAEALELLAAGDPKAEAAYAAAFGVADSLDALRDSLAALADLADETLRATDATTRALVESVDLTADDVRLAREAHAALGAARSTRIVEGAAGTHDEPATSRAEGRMLFEMRLVMGVFEAAHRRTALVPRLTPGPATRSALAPSRTERAAPNEPAAPDAGSPTTPGAVSPAVAPV